MTSADVNAIQPDGSDVNAADAQPAVVEDIVSVNKKGSKPDNKVAKGLFILFVCAILVGLLAWFSQNWLNTRKAQLRENSTPRAAADTSKVFNPEGTGTAVPGPKLGAESGATPPSMTAATTALRPGASRADGVRPLRGADGKVMVNAQGKAMGVDGEGNVVEVPAIATVSSEPGRKPLPGEAAGTSQAGQQAPKPPSRYGGALFVGEPAKATTTAAADSGNGQAAAATPEAQQAQQIADILRVAGLGAGQGSRNQQFGLGGAPATSTAAASVGGNEPMRPGTVGSALYSSSTPVAMASLMTDQNLILPKGAQADCTLSGRIVDEVPGFTSCVLAQDLYSDNGKVLLIEKGSKLEGEYGVTNQLGQERLFVTWSRCRTPQGVQIDLTSPGADRLGTSGIPGHLDNRWGARIGAALLISFVKDVSVAIINRQTQNQGTNGSTVLLGQNTMNGSSQLAEEVIKQTMKTRARLTSNQGDRVSVYVARDLDFSPVYALKTAGTADAIRVLTR